VNFMKYFNREGGVETQAISVWEPLVYTNILYVPNTSLKI
jgi:hypothetical protein